MKPSPIPPYGFLALASYNLYNETFVTINFNCKYRAFLSSVSFSTSKLSNLRTAMGSAEFVASSSEVKVALGAPEHEAHV